CSWACPGWLRLLSPPCHCPVAWLGRSRLPWEYLQTLTARWLASSHGELLPEHARPPRLERASAPTRPPGGVAAARRRSSSQDYPPRRTRGSERVPCRCRPLRRSERCWGAGGGLQIRPRSENGFGVLSPRVPRRESSSAPRVA